MDCYYTVANRSQKPIVGLIVGAGAEAAGPNEFSGLPIGSKSPRAWEFNVLSPDPNQHIAIEWQTRDSTHALMPGATLGEFTVRFAAGAQCGGVQWTAINRDSELESGIVPTP